MKRRLDLEGNKFGRLTVVSYSHTAKAHQSAKSNSAWWKCKCDCGNESLVTTHALRSDGTRSCGCLQREDTKRRLTINMVGQKYGRLTVLRKSPTARGSVRWVCKCDCGTECVKNGSSIREGSTKSCGCLLGEHNRKRFGESSFNTLLKTYRVAAKQRNLKFNLTVEQFRSLISAECYYCGAPPSNVRRNPTAYGDCTYNGIDRKNSSMGYEPDNCVTCCKNCNYGKRTQSFEEFILWVRKIYAHTIHHQINRAENATQEAAA